MFRVILTFFLLLIAQRPGFCQPGNLEVFSDLIREIIREEFEPVGFPQKSVFLIKNESAADISRMVENLFSTWVIERGSDLYRGAVGAAISSDKESFSVEFTPVSHSVDYGNEKNQKDGEVVRTIQVQLLIRVMDQKNKIVIEKNALKRYNDTISSDKLNAVEKDLFDFTKANRKQNLFQKIYGPALVSAATATIVYLFYSFRSN